MAMRQPDDGEGEDGKTICTASSTPRLICSQGRFAMTAPRMPPADLAAINKTKTAKAQYRSMATKTGG